MSHSDASSLRSYDCLEFSKVSMGYEFIYMLLEGGILASPCQILNLVTILIG
jgi:hypothetical protein